MSRPVPLLTAGALTKAHGRTTALRGASVELHAGEILAVTGPSGSGKSTLLHCLSGIVRPDAGSVTYDGRRLEDLPEKRLSELRRTEFGVMFQFGQLIPELTVLDNVALPLLLAGTDRAGARARALVTGPRVVFADEPTGALDSLAGEQVMTALVHTARESGTAVLLITHDAQVAAYADREVRLRDGAVAALGVTA